MRIALLVALLVGPLAGFAPADEPPIALRPYAIRAWVAINPSTRLDARGRADLVADWLALVRRFVGAPWIVEVAEGEGPLARRDIDALDDSALGALAETVDKGWAIRIEPDGRGGFRFLGREFDVLTGHWGPPRLRSAPYPADAARSLLGLALDLFRPTAEVGAESGGGVTLTVRGAALQAASPAGRVVGVGSVFVPLRIFQKPDGSPLGVVEVRRSYLRVASIEGAEARCEIVSGLRDPLSRRVARKNSLVALGAKPADRPTRLRYVRGDERNPAAGYTLTVRTLPDGPPREIGTTGRDGRIVLEPGLADGLILVRLLAGGVEPLDEFPMLPGEEAGERTILIDPKPEAVALETRLDAFRDELIDIVATRARLEARLKARAEGGAWDEVSSLLDEFRALPPRVTFHDRLARMKDEAARRQAETKTAILTRTAQAQIADTQALIDRYLADDAFDAYAEALREARPPASASTHPPAPEAVAAATADDSPDRDAPPAETPRPKEVARPIMTPSPTGNRSDVAWSRFEEKEFGFRVLAPGGPERSSRSTKVADTPVTEHQFAWPVGPDFEFQVRVLDGPAGSGFEAKARDLADPVATEATGVRAVSQRDFQVNGHPARDVRYELAASPGEGRVGPLLGTARVVFDGDRIYTLLCVYAAEHDARVKYLLQSFRIEP